MTMSTRISLRHRIEQRFSRAVRLSTHWLRLRPAPGGRSRVTAYSLKVEAQPHWLNWLRDPLENYVGRLDFPEPVTRLGLDVELIAELEPMNPFDFLVEPYAAEYPFDYPKQLQKELAPYLAAPASGARLDAWLDALDPRLGYIMDFLRQVNSRVNASVPRVLPADSGAIDLEATLASGTGSSRAVAWLATLALRDLGMAARLVSGYRVFLTREPSASLHAWTEVYLPGAGWVGMDPAGGLFTHEGYLPLAAAPDPLRAQPLVGYHEACEEELAESVSIRRLESDAPGRPFPGVGWGDVQAVGRQMDADLRAADVELTVQTELSFVPAGEPHLPEWNRTALGPGKRRVAQELLMRLRDRLAPGGVLQASQGEWFAGEPLPRWRLSCWWRVDGEPVCRDPVRLNWVGAREGVTLEDAERFGRTLARALGLAPECLVAAHEDGLHSLWRDETRQNPGAIWRDLREPERRRELADKLSHSFGEPRGYVLPLGWNAVEGHWTSQPWRFRRSGLFLTPGDSPMGYRLPLESLPLEAQEAAAPERCHFDERPVLPRVHGEVSARLSRMLRPASEEGADEGSETPRTAVCLEIRESRLHCFLPPLTHLEYFLDLVAAIEATARALDLSAVLEGYEPPEDFRLRRLVLEPDAGVLRMRLPAARDLPETEAWLRSAFEEAARSGLRTERVTADGRHSPPGGGAPMVLGARDPRQSPFLLRPQLLRSLIAYWHRHPSLSYLFAGRGIGPSGYAPRVDEGREETLYELSIALEHLPAGETAAPWLADRVLRHLLTDPAGDMRRAEIRVDELYEPARASRRLGRVALTAFETPPDAEFGVLQNLLVRGFMLRFLRFPERGELQPWGGQLYDRFMLPRLLWQDFLSVLDDLAEAGYPLQPDWFEPLVARRFPVLGRVSFEDVEIELRTALEPWPVLAEEVTGTGMARFLDLANDRVQVHVTGLSPGRYVLECNGEGVPLQSTGVVGEGVAGVRFKACNPPATMHPTVAPLGALVFDLVDTWSSRVVGGCTYHPARPDDWGPLVARSRAAPPLLPASEPGARHPLPPVAVPFGKTTGSFAPVGSGRVRAEPVASRPDARRPFLLDLSFPR